MKYVIVCNPHPLLERVVHGVVPVDSLSARMFSPHRPALSYEAALEALAQHRQECKHLRAGAIELQHKH